MGGLDDASRLPDHLLMLNWASKDHAHYAYALLSGTPPPTTASVALRLLAFDFPDAHVRRHAVHFLETLEEEDLLDLSLQLVQALRLESHHDSLLARFLLARAVRSVRLCDRLFWYFRAEVHGHYFRERYVLLLEMLIACRGGDVSELLSQVEVVRELEFIATAVKTVKKGEARAAALRQLVGGARLPARFDLPVVAPDVSFVGVTAQSARALDSKKVPLWLAFETTNPFADDYVAIFKVGDDLRQDMVTLQMIRAMDKLWKENRLDLHVLTYGCIATDPNVGLIQAITSASTISHIQKEMGGATAVFWEDTLRAWLRKENARAEDYQQAVENFTRSCAAYCVASYVLGIGDRHNDNIMLTTDGHFFHIDFGHFLGNIKSKFGIKRERTPFVLTSDFVRVMGGKDHAQFTKFLIYSCQAFLILRRNAALLVNLLALMITTGLPELKCDQDIDHIRNALFLDESEDSAMHKFKELTSACLQGEWSVKTNWLIHNLARG